MVDGGELRKAVDNVKAMLRANHRECETSPADLLAWFEADTPFDDLGLDEVIKNPILVIHELVEIMEVRKRGLSIGTRTIIDNLEKVDDAHLVATKVELMCAMVEGDSAHIRDRMEDIKAWTEDPTVTPGNKRKYRRMLVTAENMAEAAAVVRPVMRIARRQAN